MRSERKGAYKEVRDCSANDENNEIRRLSSRVSFTLIEMLLVMMIIITLTGVIIGSIGYVNRKGGEAKTSAFLAKIAAAIEQYKADWGVYPLSDQPAWGRDQAQTNYNCQLVTNLGGLGGGKRYIEWARDETNMVVAGGANRLYIVDAFGTPIAYYPATNNDNTTARGAFPGGRVNFTSYDLWSFGGNLKSTNAATAADDIKNW